MPALEAHALSFAAAAEHLLSAGRGGQLTLRAGSPELESCGQKPCQHAGPQVIQLWQGSHSCELNGHAFWEDRNCCAAPCC